MNIRQTQNFAPDGFAATRQNRDAGLYAAVAAATSGQGSDGSESGEAGGQHYNLNHHDGYDDGLVHSHGWAASE